MSRSTPALVAVMLLALGFVLCPQESASAAEELNSQAEELSGMVSTFVLSNVGRQLSAGHAEHRPQLQAHAGAGAQDHAAPRQAKPVAPGARRRQKPVEDIVKPEQVIPLEEKELQDF